MGYRTVLWDFDGTLVDTSDGIFKSLKVAFSGLGLPVPEPETLHKFIGPPMMFSFTTYIGLEKEDADRAVTFFREDYTADGIFHSKVYDGLPELISQLRAHGIKVGVSTLKPEYMARQLLERFDLLPQIDVCVGSSSDEKGTATKAEIVLETMRQLGEDDPSRTVLIGDTVFDADGAREAGIDFVGVSYGFGIRPEQSEELGCRFVAANAAELGRFLLKNCCHCAESDVK